MLRKIESAQRHVRVLNLKKTGLGTPVLGGMDAFHATIVDNGVGSYSIVPNVAFAEAPNVMVTPVTANGIASLGTITASSIQVLTKDLGLSPVYASATLDLIADIVLTKKDAGDFANGHTFTTEVIAVAANPTNTVLVVFTGNESAVICTITPNSGANNVTTPGVAASGILDLTADITLTKATASTTHNGHIVTTQVVAAAPNPAATVLMVVTGTANATIITVTPNDGTNNTATPVNLTTAQLVLAIQGKTSATFGGVAVTITDVGSLLANFGATGGGATSLVDAGEGDGVVATFANGVTQVLTPVTVTTANLVELINTGLITGKVPTITDTLSLRVKATATGGGATAMANSGEGDSVVATYAGGSDIIAQAAKEMDFHVTIFGTDAKDRT